MHEIFPNFLTQKCYSICRSGWRQTPKSCLHLSCLVASGLFVDLQTVAPSGSSVHKDYPGKKTGVDFHFLLQGSS